MRRLRRSLSLRRQPPLLPPQAAGSPAGPPPSAEHSRSGLRAGCPPGPARPSPSTKPGREAQGAGAGARGLRRAQRPRPVAGSVGCGVWGGVGDVGTAPHARSPFGGCAGLLARPLGWGGRSRRPGAPQSLPTSAAPQYLLILAVRPRSYSSVSFPTSCLIPTFRPCSCLSIGEPQEIVKRVYTSAAKCGASAAGQFLLYSLIAI